MALIIPAGPDWAYYTNNYPSTPSSSFYGTTVTADPDHTKGTAVTCLDDLTHDCEYLEISISGFSASNTAHQVLVDILFDPAGGTSWSVLIPNLLGGYTVSPAITVPQARLYSFPIWVPAGTSIGAQAQTAHTASRAGFVHITARGGNANPSSWWCGQGVEAIGVDAASSQGTLITPGNSGAFSSWVDLGAPTVASRNAGAIQWAVQSDSASTAGRVYRIEFGAGSNAIGPSIHYYVGSGENGWMHNQGPIFKSIRSGTQLQARGTAGATNSEQLGCAAYLVY